MSQSPQPPDPPIDANEPGSDDAQPFEITLPDDPASGADWYLWAAVLALFALVSFWPAISGTFLWDDDQYVTQNKALLDASGLKEIWKIPPGTIQYYPLSFTALWVEHHFWENNSLGYRVVNLILHAGAGLILWRILRRLSIPAAWAAATIWAIHPLQAESVCWISECKNILSGILALASVLFYLEFVGLRDPDSKHRIWDLPEEWHLYAISAGFFLLAMLSKTSVCFLPVAIFVILWWKRRLSSKSILGLLPMLVIGALLAWETSRLETDPNGPIGASGPEWQQTLAQRFQIAGHDLWFYLGKLLLPIHQSFIYPRHVPAAGDIIEWIPLIAALVVIALLALGIKKIGRGPLVAVLCYIAALFPALGFANVFPFRYSFVADHFQYLAGIPLIALAVWIVSRIAAPLWRPRDAAPGQRVVGKSAPIAVIIAVVLLVLGVTSWNRAAVFAEPLTLWQDVLRPDKNPHSWLAAYNLAILTQKEAADSFDDAASYHQAKDEDSSKASAADALSQLDESNRLLQSVLDNPDAPDDQLYKANDQIAENDITRMRSPDSDSSKLLQDAADQLNHALSFEIARGDPLPYYTLGVVDLDLAQQLQKRLTPATQVATTSVTTRPATPQERQFVDLYQKARENFGRSCDLALAALNSTRIRPEALQVLPLAAFQQGNVDWTLAEFAHDHNDLNSENQLSRDAVADYGRAVQFTSPSNEARDRLIEARFRLALALENLGDLPSAKANLLVILTELDHHNALAFNEIGRVILESRPTDMAEYEAAVESFRQALVEDPNLVGARRNLGLALKMLASTRPTTQPSTAPSSHPSP